MKKLFLISFFSLTTISSATEFIGTGAGAIADGGGACGGAAGTARTLSFVVNNESQVLRDININIEITHSWLGDVSAKLIAPDATELILFARTAATTANDCGSGATLQGDYIFGDTATDNWWTNANNLTNGNPMPNLSYRTSTAGGSGVGQGTLTSLMTSFGNISNINGTWTLEVTDSAAGDTGTVTSASLFLTTAIFANGFE